MNPSARYGDYTIIRRIGSGNMGIVYLATRMDTGRQVAIKVINGGHSSDDQERIELEENGARVQQAVPKEEARVVTVNRVQRFEADLVIEMEYVQGDDLGKAMQPGMDADRAARIGLELCRMLENVNKLDPPVVHGDLKPKNVLLTGDATIKVIDFGIAKRPERAEGTINPFWSIPYSSPERIRSGGMVNVQSDLWAIAVMLYQMAGGRHPFAVSNGDEMRSRILDGKGPNAFSSQRLCPEPLRNIVFKALAPLLADRYATPKEMGDDLERFLAKQPVLAAAPDDETTRRTDRPAIDESNKTVRTSAVRPLRPVPVLNRITGRWRPILKLALWGVVCAAAIYFVNNWFRVSEEADGIRKQISAGEISTGDAWKKYEDLRGRTRLPLIGVRDSLKRKLSETGNEPIYDYRRDQPTAREGEWERAATAFRRLLEFDPKDATVNGRLHVCEGHLSRIRAVRGSLDHRTIDQKTLNQGIQHFEEASRLMPDSPDPYIGLAHIFFYEEPDFDRGVEMINQAAKRGHPAGKRETMEKADCLRNRADREFQKAMQYADMRDQSRQDLQRARADYISAIESYNEIADFMPRMRIPSIIRRLTRSVEQVDELLQNASGTQ
jgi:tetratricopeptide (TPR) repeat protein/predicted Ser/Thr protein kinase